MSAAEMMEAAQNATGHWTEERFMIRDTALDFTLNEVLPVAFNWHGQDGSLFGVLLPCC